MSRAHKISGASFRDPSGFIYYRNGQVYRQINNIYKKEFKALETSGLLDVLIERNLLIKHVAVPNKYAANQPQAYKIIKPEKVPLISYPYEWSFSQLKDAALTTLKIHLKALEHGMVLKDASAYNMQFVDGVPKLIDTLSFERYVEGKPWVAYKQFCQHFLAPLALMAYKDARMVQLLRVYIDGVPLDLASKLLPAKTKLKPFLASHIHLHARSQQKHASDSEVKRVHMGKKAHISLIKNLTNTIKSLNWAGTNTEWGEYYTFTNYSSKAFKEKEKIIKSFIKHTKPISVWDLGANTGFFSRIASSSGIFTTAFDIDPIAVEKNYLEMKEKGEKNILPLLVDLTNPSPAMGWAHSERDSLQTRANADLVMALALVHHLAISNNVPFLKIAEYFSKLGKNLIVEFATKQDSQVKKLLSTRKDIFSNYNTETFKKDFSKFYRIKKQTDINNTNRSIFLMTKY